MLVYIRDGERPSLLDDISSKSIPQYLKDKFSAENEMHKYLENDLEIQNEISEFYLRIDNQSFLFQIQYIHTLQFFFVKVH